MGIAKNQAEGLIQPLYRVEGPTAVAAFETVNNGQPDAYRQLRYGPTSLATQKERVKNKRMYIGNKEILVLEIPIQAPTMASETIFGFEFTSTGLGPNAPNYGDFTLLDLIQVKLTLTQNLGPGIEINFQNVDVPTVAQTPVLGPGQIRAPFKVPAGLIMAKRNDFIVLEYDFTAMGNNARWVQKDAMTY